MGIWLMLGFVGDMTNSYSRKLENRFAKKNSFAKPIMGEIEIPQIVQKNVVRPTVCNFCYCYDDDVSMFVYHGFINGDFYKTSYPSRSRVGTFICNVCALGPFGEPNTIAADCGTFNPTQAAKDISRYPGVREVRVMQSLIVPFQFLIRIFLDKQILHVCTLPRVVRYVGNFLPGIKLNVKCEGDLI